MPLTLANIVIYADNPLRLAHFWSKVFGYPLWEWTGPMKSRQMSAGLTDIDLSKRALAVPAEGEPGPRFVFRHASEQKSSRNRLHLDIQATPGRPSSREELETEKDRLVQLGAEPVRLIDKSWGAWPELYYQLSDPEGNEFCLQSA